MKNRFANFDSVQIARFELTRTMKKEVYVELPSQILDDDDDDAIREIIAACDEHEDATEYLDEDFDFEVELADPETAPEPVFRAIRTAESWIVESLLERIEPSRSLGQLHQIIVQRYNGQRPLEYSFVPCIDLNGSVIGIPRRARGKGVAYYCDGFVVLVVLWTRHWGVAVLTGFDKQYPIHQTTGAIPISSENRVALEHLDESDAFDVHQAYQAVLDAGMPSTQSKISQKTIEAQTTGLPSDCDLVVSPKTKVADDPDALLQGL